MTRPKRSCVRPVPQISFLEDDDEAVAVSPARAAASSQQHSKSASSGSENQSAADAADAGSGSEYEDEEEPEEAPSATVSKAKRPVSIWVPESRSDRCYFSELPLEILDLILSYDTLTLRDHCVMAGVNRTLREAYSNDDLWYKLRAFRPLPTCSPGVPTAGDMLVLSTIMTRKPLHPKLFERREIAVETNRRAHATSPAVSAVDKSTVSQLVRLLGPSHTAALGEVSTLSVSQSEAMSTWKVSKAQLGKLSYGTKVNLYGIHPVKLFSIASVESMALRLHCNEYGNGPMGHEEYKERLEERKERIEATKRANGTWRPKVNRGPPRVLPRFRRRRYY